MEKGVRITLSGDMLIAALSGEIDHHHAAESREEIDGALFRHKPQRLLLDFSAVKFMDSSGIALIIGRAELARSIGCTVIIGGMSDAQRKLVALSGISKLENIKLER